MRRRIRIAALLTAAVFSVAAWSVAIVSTAGDMHTGSQVAATAGVMQTG